MNPGDLKQNSDGTYTFQTTQGPTIIKESYIERFLLWTLRPKWFNNLSYYKKFEDMKKKNTSYNQEDLDEGWVPMKIEDIEFSYNFLLSIHKKLNKLDRSLSWRMPYITACHEGDISCQWDSKDDLKSLTLYLSIQESWAGLLWHEDEKIRTMSIDISINKFLDLWLWLHDLKDISSL